MALSDEEIRRNLTRFAADWGGYRGTERSEAQTFCNELLGCYGTTRKEVASFEERTAEGGFIDMIWPEVCLIEMKRPSEAEKLDAHREQGLNYWMEVSKQAGESGLKAPEWIVLCAFERFEVLDPDAGWDRPVDSFRLAELPERLNSLKFLAEEEPYFRSSQADLSREAVAALTNLYAALRQRRASDLDTLRVFILQVVWAMFAEDLGLIQNNVLSRVLEGLVKDSTRSSADDLGQLFRYLAEREPRPHEGSLYEGTPFANGGLFVQPALVHLEKDELEILLIRRSRAMASCFGGPPRACQACEGTQSRSALPRKVVALRAPTSSHEASTERPGSVHRWNAARSSAALLLVRAGDHGK